MDQKTALDVLKLGYNVYLTGPAGSGKTFLLNQYIQYLKKNGIPVAITASTGIAATHISGTTIHSWSGMGVKNKLEKRDLVRIYRNSRLRSRIKKTKVLVIDEISMLHGFQIEMVDEILRFVKQPLLPFGGAQVVLCGDFFQLPPVNKQQEQTRFVFESEIWERMDAKICYLDEIKRQEDDKMKKILKDIRAQKVKRSTWNAILSRQKKDVKLPIRPTRLFTTNKDVDHINNKELEKIAGEAYRYTMKEEGKRSFLDILERNCLAAEKIVLKKGALVMFLKNNFDAGYVNGTMGIIFDFDKESKLPIVKTAQGKNILVSPADWTFEQDGKVLATIKQLPLKLAWAITVHKSQGMTLDAAEIDLGRTFAYGMGYVALSRVKSLSGIKLLGIDRRALEIDPKMVEFDASLIRFSKGLANEVRQMSWVERLKKQGAIRKQMRR